MTNTITWSAYRDDPVEHVRTITKPNHSSYYECSVCTFRCWPTSNEALEEFLVEHDKCGEQK